jgi:hypothetical protein
MRMSRFCGVKVELPAYVSNILLVTPEGNNIELV